MMLTLKVRKKVLNHVYWCPSVFTATCSIWDTVSWPNGSLIALYFQYHRQHHLYTEFWTHSRNTMYFCVVERIVLLQISRHKYDGDGITNKEIDLDLRLVFSFTEVIHNHPEWQGELWWCTSLLNTVCEVKEFKVRGLTDKNEWQFNECQRRHDITGWLFQLLSSYSYTNVV